MEAQGEYLFLLNPDAQMVENNYLEVIYDYALNHPSCGIFSTRILELNGCETGPFFTYPYQQEFNDLPGDIAAVIGAVMLIKASIYQAVGGFDTDYFLYEEDIDLCLRIRKAGYSIAKVNELSVLHVGGVSEKNTQLYDYTIKKQRGIYLFCYKHYSKEFFQRILVKERKKARLKLCILWFKFSLLGSKKHKLDQQKWLAKLYCSQKAIIDPSWLIFSKGKQDC